MKLQQQVMSSINFLRFITIYIVISFVAFLLTTGGYSTLYFIFGIAPFYMVIWILLAFATISSKRVRYSSILAYLVLLVQSIAILLNIADSGYYGITCKTKNFIQYFFDFSSCGGLWVSSEVYLRILGLYVLVVMIFIINLFQLRFSHPEDRFL